MWIRLRDKLVYAYASLHQKQNMKTWKDNKFHSLLLFQSFGYVVVAFILSIRTKERGTEDDSKIDGLNSSPK